jgi:plasmid stability protein
MAVNLSIKNVPDELADRLRARARRNHRSLQGEVMAILEAAAFDRPIDVDQLYARIQKLGLRTPDQATRMIRELRDAR